MKTLFVIILLCLTTPTFAKAPAKLKYKIDFLFSHVLEKKRQTINDSIPFPTIHYSSKTPLKKFQDAIEKQWGMRPKSITNAYAIESNEIFIMDDARYYESLKRCMDDSLVHEIVHFVQVKYLNWDLNDESLEWDAVDIQTNFRNEFCPIL